MSLDDMDDALDIGGSAPAFCNTAGAVVNFAEFLLTIHALTDSTTC